jgi:hypothetical protein
MRQIIGQCVQNQLKFRYVLMDSWFAAKENFEFILRESLKITSPLKKSSKSRFIKAQTGYLFKNTG